MFAEPMCARVHPLNQKQIKSAISSAIKSKTAVPQPNLGRNIAIIDRLNTQPLYGWRFERTIRKLCIVKGDAPTVILALSLVDMAVKNCPRFRPYVNTSTFANALKKALPSSIRDPQGRDFHQLGEEPTPAEAERINKILLLVQAWASIPLSNWKALYDDLAKKGCEFPKPLKGEASPLDYDDTKVAATNTVATSAKSSAARKASAAPKYKTQVCNQANTLFEVFDDMIRANAGGSPATDPVVQELRTQTQALQKRIQQRLGTETNEQAMGELLEVNDMFNDLQTLYKAALSGAPLPEARRGAAGDAKSDAKAGPTATGDSKSSDKKAAAAATATPNATPTGKDAKASGGKKEKAGGSLDILGLGMATAPGGPVAAQPAAPVVKKEASGDLLDSLFADSSRSSGAAAAGAPAGGAPATQRQTSAFDDDIFMKMARKSAGKGQK